MDTVGIAACPHASGAVVCSRLSGDRGVGAGGGLERLSPQLLQVGLISKIAPHFLCPKIFCRALFVAIRQITV